jgi:hypothetical protein
MSPSTALRLYVCVVDIVFFSLPSQPGEEVDLLAVLLALAVWKVQGKEKEKELTSFLCLINFVEPGRRFFHERCFFCVSRLKEVHRDPITYLFPTVRIGQHKFIGWRHPQG